MRRIAKILLSIYAVIVTFTCLFCVVFSLYDPAWSIEENWTVFRRKLQLSGIEAAFDTMADELPHTESDTVLITHNAAHHLGIARGIKWGPGCIFGSTITIYGSTQDFEAVASEYETLLADREDWTNAGPDPNYRKYVHKSGKAVFDIIFNAPSDFDYPPECAGYPTCYSTKLVYADPSIGYCFG